MLLALVPFAHELLNVDGVQITRLHWPSIGHYGAIVVINFQLIYQIHPVIFWEVFNVLKAWQVVIKERASAMA